MPHIHEKIDFTVDVFIVHKSKVLLRMHEKYHKWLVPGGHIELEETPPQAALREAKEEVGLNVKLASPRKIFEVEENEYKELIPPWYSNIHKINDSHDHISLIYFATSDSDNVKPEHGGDISNEWRWFSKEDLDKNEEGVSKEIVFYAQGALKELGE